MATGLSYKKTADYYASVPPTINGVLGGFGHISDIDINGSKAFLEKVFALETPPGTELALDCGAGIGRVTKHLLMPRFDKVDLLEQEPKFINAAKQSIGENNAKLGSIYHDGIQRFKFDKSKKYDIIWCQWVLSHINDKDIVGFFNRCRSAIKDNGVVVVKENINSVNETVFDEDDSSITRPVGHMIQLFKDASFEVVLTEVQAGFPKDIYSVLSFLLVPSREPNDLNDTKSTRKSNKVHIVNSF